MILKMILLALNLFIIPTFSTSVDNKYIDLSYSLSEETIFMPGQRQFELKKDYDGVTLSSGFWFSSYSFCVGEHVGTHLDAPFHVNKDGWTVDKIPPSHLIDVPAAVIDVEAEVNSEEFPNQFALQVRHLIEYEANKKPIPFGAVVLIHTGWSKFISDKAKYIGWDNSTLNENGLFSLKFPGVSKEAAQWLADERQIVGLGIDTYSVDLGSASTTYPHAHELLGKKQIYNIENVANLHLVIAKAKSPHCNLHLFVLPLKIIGGTGGPVRVLAYCK